MALMPRESAKLIARLAKNVFIEEEGINGLACEVLEGLKNRTISINNFSQSELHPNPGHSKAVDWIFVLDTLNFSFWPNNDDNKWKVNGHTGYFALCAAIKRAIDEGIPIIDPNYYVNITSEDLGRILRADVDAGPAPLLEQRVKNLQQVGKILLDKFNGTFVECIKASKYSAEKLLKLIVSNFECFRDEANFHGHRVSFYKRAQILIGDIWSCYKGSDLGEFNDVDVITMFADYRVPQVLLHFGAMRYSNPLLSTLQTGSEAIQDDVQSWQTIKNSAMKSPNQQTILLDDIFDRLEANEDFAAENKRLYKKYEDLKVTVTQLNQRVNELAESQAEIRTDVNAVEEQMMALQETTNKIIQLQDTNLQRIQSVEDNFTNFASDFTGRMHDLEAWVRMRIDDVLSFDTNPVFRVFHQRLLRIEAVALSKELVLLGFPETNEENLKKIVISIFSTLETNLSAEDLLEVHRIGIYEENFTKPRAIRICLKSKLHCDLLIEAKKKKKHLDAAKISPILPKKSIDIQRRVPHKLLLLRRKILEQWTQLRPRDVWLGRSAVLVRLHRNEEPIQIYFEGDFHLLPS